MQKPIINLADLNFTAYAHGAAFAASTAPVANLIGADKLGYRMVKVPPGKSACPCHSHLVNEEMFFILEGSGTFIQAQLVYPVRQGDVIAAVVGKEMAHELINTGTVELVYLAVSTMQEPEVCFYPESGKFGVMAGTPPGRDAQTADLRFFGREADGVEYWDGED